MTDKKGFLGDRSSVLRRAALTMGCCAAALAVAQGQAMAGSPSPELPIAGGMAPTAPDCGNIFCGHIVPTLQGIGFPVLPHDYQLKETPIEISIPATEGFSR